MEPTENKDAPADKKEQAAKEAQAVKTPGPGTQPVRARSWGAIVLALLAIVLAAGLAGLSWYDTRTQVDATQAELARRLNDVQTQSHDARMLAQQAQDSAREIQTRLGQIESSIAGLQSQKAGLERLYQDLTRNRDELQLAEIEQVLSIASQRLELSGNVHAALLALQSADRQLARADNPQYLPVRKAIAHDIEQLKAVPALDVPGLSLRIDEAVAAVGGLPLAYDERAAAPKASAGGAEVSGKEAVLARLGAQVWAELRKLVVVRKVESPEPPLLPPSQTYFLRENLRLRLLNARLSLLIRDEAGYRGDLQAAETWLRQYFDTRSKRVADVLSQLDQLASVSLDVQVPSISDSLEAVRAVRARAGGGG
jgi:uroporphyrin-3 C-methyltransferase